MTSASQNKSWLSVEIETARDGTEAVEFALLESGALGTEISMFGKQKDAGLLTVVGYFDEKAGTQEAQELREKLPDMLVEALRIYDFSPGTIKATRWKTIEQRDWLAEWKKGWQPVESGRFIVAPPWSEMPREIPDAQDKIIIRIEPGMAFGTGTHETTRLCLQAIDKYYAGGSFLDLGTGTAVLAIAAVKMFPESKIEACDTDAEAVEIARENAAFNGVADKIKFYMGTVTEGAEEFDLICANLTADVILPLLPLLIKKTRKTLVLSGILTEQKETVLNELSRSGQDNFTVDQLGEWVSITLSKK